MFDMFSDPQQLYLFVLRIPVILMALTLHEYAHGYVAFLCGDSTARDQGRLTFNPVAHLDFLGALMLMFGPFGWAKPVPVNGYKLRNIRRDTFLVSIAGPASNIVLAAVLGYFLRFGLPAMPFLDSRHLTNFLQLGFIINIGIAFFNLLPIPPLDGSKIVLSVLPPKWVPVYIEKSRYVPTLFIILMVAQWSFNIPIFSKLFNPLFIPFYSVMHFLVLGEGF